MYNNTYEVICFGEILWDVLPQSAVPCGAPMNVAYHLNKLGKSPALITRIGFDDKGKELINLLSGYGISTDFFQVDYHTQTGVVYARLKSNNEVVYDIVKPAAWDYIQWEADFETLIGNASYFVFGSLIARNAQSKNILFQCMEIAKTKVLDINIRSSFLDQKLIEELLKKTDVLKMNIAELHLVSNWYKDYKSDLERVRALKDRFNINSIIVTKGGDGALLHLDETFYSHPGYTVKVVDASGSGDAFLAAIISKLIDRAPPVEALDFANRLGAYVATSKGSCPDYTLSILDRIHILQN